MLFSEIRLKVENSLITAEFNEYSFFLIDAIRNEQKVENGIIYLINRLTFATLMSYNFLTAARTWFLLARKWAKNTNVLLSSIFFIAASVVNGYLIMLNASMLQMNKEKNIFCLGFVFGWWNFHSISIFYVFHIEMFTRNNKLF